MRFVIILVITMLFTNQLLAQESNSQLETKLKTSTGKERFSILYKLSKGYLSSDSRKSADYAKQAMDEAKKLNNLNFQADAGNILGTINFNQKNYKAALKFYEEELNQRKELKQEEAVAKTLYNIGSVYESWEKTSKAVESYQLAIETAKRTNSPEIVYQCYESVVRIYHLQKDFKNAYDVLRAYMAYRTSNKFTIEKIAILETQVKEEKKTVELTTAKLKQKDSTINLVTSEKETLVKDTVVKSQAINELTTETIEQKLTIEEQKEENRRQRQWIMAFIVFITVVVVFSVLLHKQYRAKKLAHKKLLIYNAEIIEQKEEIQSQAEMLLERNKEIEEQKEEIRAQAEELAIINKEITKHRDEILFQQNQIKDSIRYASRIQRVMLPEQQFMDGIFRENMVLWRPQEIVSGDFYWVRQVKNFIVFAAADCTGHGVPGAFMSMLGISFLNEIVSKSRFDKSNEILNLLRKRIKQALNQTGKENEATDGMDIALCVLDTENNILQYSGAYNPLYLIRNNEMQVFRADHQPIAIYPKERDFTYNEIELQKDDVIYITSDGYIDQFGGDNNEKLKAKRFRELLLNVHQKPMHEQKQLLNDYIQNWMGKNNSQIDDILIFGVRI